MCNFLVFEKLTGLILQIAREIILLLFNKVHKKITKSQDRRNFESVCALFVICTRVTTLHSCFMRLYSAN